MVLNTPLTAFAAHERYAVFFRPDFVICGRVACIPKNSLMTKVAGRLLAVFKYLTAPLNMGFMNKTNRTSIMKTISAENLPLIAHNQLPVITTELLAQLYGTETANIKMNFSRNTKRFVQGKHFFKLEGDDLREFKHSMSLRPSVSDEVTESYPVKIARNVRSLILWTERGAARHAKMLETDQAWEVFEKLEDCYFSQKQPASSTTKHSYPTHSNNVPKFRYLVKLTYKDTLTGQVETFTGRANSPDEIIQGTAKRFGMYITEMIVMPVNAYC